MTTVSHVERYSVSTIVGGGLKLGALTTVGVTAFALVSRPLAGTTEAIIQSVLVIAGGVVFSFWPSLTVRPRSIDGVGWTAMLGLMGALFFTVFDTVILRPIDMYHWSWDQIGGGSGFWYIPVWWMGSAYLAALGGMLVAFAARGAESVSLGPVLIRTLGLSAAVFLAVVLTGLFPATPATVALGFTGGITLDAVIGSVRSRG